MRELNYGEAIAEALLQCMEADPSVFILGIGVNDVKGIFGTTLKAAQKYGGQRVIETPACENAMTGMAIGMAMNGKRPVIVHARNDFSFLAMDQMFNYAAKWRYMFGGGPHVPIVVRNIVGKGWGQGATHSQDLRAVYAYFPGLQVIAPASAYDMKGMLVHSLRSGTPTVIFEHRRLYDMVSDVPEELYEVPFGKASILREGTDITLAASSLMVPEAMKVCLALEAVGASAELVDVRSIRPFDAETLTRSVGKTGRLLILDSGWTPFGVPAEIAASIATHPVVHALKCPIRRMGMADCPAPVSRTLEDAYYPEHRGIFRTVLEMIGRDPAIPYDWPQTVETFKGPY